MLKSHSKIQSVRSFMLAKGVPGTITNQCPQNCPRVETACTAVFIFSW